jgi:hypothetical protein
MSPQQRMLARLLDLFEAAQSTSWPMAAVVTVRLHDEPPRHIGGAELKMVVCALRSFTPANRNDDPAQAAVREVLAAE